MKTKYTSPVLVLSAAVMALSLGACSTPGNSNGVYGATLTDEAFGNAVREARLRQTIDMEAGGKHQAMTGGDANTAGRALKSYHKSYEEPQKTIKVLGIGSDRDN